MSIRPSHVSPAQTVRYGCQNRGPPGCIVNYVYTTTISPKFRQLGIQLIAVFPGAAREPAHNN
jgi:hypothetical protein